MTGTDVELAARYLEQGQIVGIPTETVYGLAGNALNEDAVLSIFKIKNRPFFDPLIIHVDSLESAKKYVLEFPSKAMKLAKQFWPGPLTLLLHKNDKIPFLVTSGSEKVAVRVPDNPFTLALLKHVDFPLAAPSANPFGYISPTSAEHVEKQLGKSIPYILDGGPCQVGLESTIVDCTLESPVILRLGGLPVSAIESALKEKLLVRISANSNPDSPGQLDKHYAPNTLFVLSENLNKTIVKHKGRKIAVLNFGQNKIESQVFELNLSETGSLDEAAHNLFDYMRRLDNGKFDIIIAKKLPEEGLGLAINDRLRRASVR